MAHGLLRRTNLGLSRGHLRLGRRNRLRLDLRLDGQVVGCRVDLLLGLMNARIAAHLIRLLTLLVGGQLRLVCRALGSRRTVRAHLGLIVGHCRRIGLVCLVDRGHGVVVVLLGRRELMLELKPLGGGQWSVSGLQASLSGLQACLCLGEACLGRRRIDPGEHLARLDRLAYPDIDLRQLTRRSETQVVLGRRDQAAGPADLRLDCPSGDRRQPWGCRGLGRGEDGVAQDQPQKQDPGQP